MKLKYDLEVLSWQQFEVFSFKVLQIEVSKSIQFIEGGNDKGRDLLFSGVTTFFGESSNHLSYLFQVKHRTGQKPFADLKADLKGELQKVFIDNNLSYDCYCLVTNLTISGDQFDELNESVNVFFDENGKTPSTFHIFSYRHFESVIDSNLSLKWDFPMVVPRADFQSALLEIFDRSTGNLVKGWARVFEKNQERFVYTAIYELAKNKLSQENVLLLSGPPKSGKTFTAEMIVLSLLGSESFSPLKIDNIEDFDRLYNKDAKQVFLFDDAFGKHNLDNYRADFFDRKLDYIFELIDENHKCLFTSWEYIVRAFSEYSDKELAKFIEKIIVETSKLTLPERESILTKYYQLKFDSQLPFDDVLLDKVITHPNFSPETIRSYFDDSSVFHLDDFINHLKAPDKYLERLFLNLSEEKKVVLLSILFSLHGDGKTIAYAFENVSADLNKVFLLNLTNELRLLEGSVVKTDGALYSFYHPSMSDFFVNFLGGDLAVYRKILLKNLNVSLISLLTFQLDSKRRKQIHVEKSDVSSLEIGFERIFKNPEVSLSEINNALSWVQIPDIQLNLKVKSNAEYKTFKAGLERSLKAIDLQKYLQADPYLLTYLLKTFKNEFGRDIIDISFIESILAKRKSDSLYWLLVFRVMPFMTDEMVFNNSILGKEWLNNFFVQMRNEINSLGSELYGAAYPHFPEVNRYQLLRAEKKFDEAAKLKFTQRSDHKQDTNRFWFPRYRVVKEKMNVLKTCRPHGYLMFEKLQPLFQHLVVLEDNQRNRYFFNKTKKWW